MRSLFTEDIPGAKPTHRYFDKQLYRKNNLKQIERFGPKNPEYKRVFQWYSPSKRIVEPIERNSSIIKPHSIVDNKGLDGMSRMSQSNILSRNKQYQVTGKVTEGISLTHRNSSVFSEAAKKSLGGDNPYFPHTQSLRNQDNSSKLTGIRDWNQEIRKKIQIPTADQQYFPKWS